MCIASPVFLQVHAFVLHPYLQQHLISFIRLCGAACNTVRVGSRIFPSLERFHPYSVGSMFCDIPFHSRIWKYNRRLWNEHASSVGNVLGFTYVFVDAPLFRNILTLNRFSLSSSGWSLYMHTIARSPAAMTSSLETDPGSLHYWIHESMLWSSDRHEMLLVIQLSQYNAILWSWSWITA